MEEVDVVELTRNFHSLYRVYHLKKNERKQNQKRDRSQRGKGKQKPKILIVSFQKMLSWHVMCDACCFIVIITNFYLYFGKSDKFYHN